MVKPVKRIKPRKRKTRIEDLEIPLPELENIAKSLKKKIDLEVRKTKYAPAKEVLTMLAGGVVLVTSIVMPGLALGLKAFVNSEDKGYVSKKEWKKFNPSYLAMTLKRLEKQKLIEFSREGKFDVIKITSRGQRKVLKYAFDELEIKRPTAWNGKWYFVTYDVPKGKSYLRDIMRNFLQGLGFYRFHESLYIHAYPCENEIGFLRRYLGISEFVKVLVVNKIENDKVFRDYFGI